ncbi:Clr5 domain protein [Pleurostoma richardsiae]|uniref:Clr5 domain protein n=1 Tax=Pleurostoma richardsiae TaxID=41990 RepID=A0AA38RTL6_9PEZI|nr:Clr5 domain protein [Pleurostoma richardsiae]
MTYDWEPHKETCRRLYVDEKKKLPQIAEYFRIHHDFVPSMRTFQVKFRQWGFPLKQPRSASDEALVARIKELWEQNLSQKQMLRTLTQKDGFNVSKRELVRIRTKNRWLLRVNTSELEKKTGIARHVEEDSEDDESENDSDSDDSPAPEAPETVNQRPASPVVPPHVLAEREERRRRMEQESAELYAARKRRRRTLPRAGLPPDPPGPPRFPSETTLTEAKAILDLDRQTYMSLRKKIQWVCEEAGVFKKTVAGPEKWEAVKDRIVAETPHLRSQMWIRPDNIERKKLALDVIAADVTKGMRTKGKIMRLAEARTILGMNPEDAREVRFSLWKILKDDNYETKLALGEERWNELKQQWITGSGPLQNVLSQAAQGQERQIKLKAIHVLARDVMKRLRDDQLRRQREKGARADQGDEDAEGSDEDMPGDSSLAANDYGADDVSGMSLVAADNARIHSQARLVPAGGLDPQPELDAQLASTMAMAAGPPARPASQQYDGPFAASRTPQAFQAPVADTIAIFLRPHHTSTFPVDSSMWIATLNSRTVIELRRAATEKYPGAACLRIEGVLKDGSGREVPLRIDQDQQLTTYLAHEEVSPTFNVQLVPAWNPS